MVSPMRERDVPEVPCSPVVASFTSTTKRRHGDQAYRASLNHVTSIENAFINAAGVEAILFYAVMQLATVTERSMTSRRRQGCVLRIVTENEK